MPKKGSFIYQRTSGQWEERYGPSYKAGAKTRHDHAYGRAGREAPDKRLTRLTVSPRLLELPRAPDFQDTALEWLEQKAASRQARYLCQIPQSAPSAPSARFRRPFHILPEPRGCPQFHPDAAGARAA